MPKRLLETEGPAGISLTTKLTIHHHWDHLQGNVELAYLGSGLAVLGTNKHICMLTYPLPHGQNFEFVEPCNVHVRAKLS